MTMTRKLIKSIRGTEEILVEIAKRESSGDKSTFKLTFKEVGGKERTFSHTYQNGPYAPKPFAGTAAIIRVNRRGQVLYAGSAS